MNALVLIVLTLAAAAVSTDDTLLEDVDPKISSSPHHVALKRAFTYEFMCSGSIIDEEWVLTIADCVHDIHVTNVTVSVGSSYATKDAGYGYGVARIVEHPKYASQRSDYYNVALVKIDGSIRFTTNVKAIALSSFVKLPTNLQLQLSGWGAVPTETLKRVSLRSASNDKCHGPDPKLERYVLCATHTTKGWCLGDEGGAVTYDGQLIGISSNMNLSCTGAPVMFLKIGRHRTWIMSTMKDLPNITSSNELSYTNDTLTSIVNGLESNSVVISSGGESLPYSIFLHTVSMPSYTMSPRQLRVIVYTMPDGIKLKESAFLAVSIQKQIISLNYEYLITTITRNNDRSVKISLYNSWSLTVTTRPEDKLNIVAISTV